MLRGPFTRIGPRACHRSVTLQAIGRGKSGLVCRSMLSAKPRGYHRFYVKHRWCSTICKTRIRSKLARCKLINFSNFNLLHTKKNAKILAIFDWPNSPNSPDSATKNSHRENGFIGPNLHRCGVLLVRRGSPEGLELPVLAVSSGCLKTR